MRIQDRTRQPLIYIRPLAKFPRSWRMIYTHCIKIFCVPGLLPRLQDLTCIYHALFSFNHKKIKIKNHITTTETHPLQVPNHGNSTRKVINLPGTLSSYSYIYTRVLSGPQLYHHRRCAHHLALITCAARVRTRTQTRSTFISLDKQK